MDMKLILIGVVLVGLIWGFGSNPVEQGPPLTREEKFQQDVEKRLSGEGGSVFDILTGQAGGGGAAGGMFGAPTGAYGGYPTLPPGMQNNPYAVQGAAGVITAPQLSADAVRQAEERRIPAFYLKSGQRIFFQEYKVFTLARDGLLQPLPDGTYEMLSGEKIYIRGGQRQAPGQ